MINVAPDSYFNHMPRFWPTMKSRYVPEEKRHCQLCGVRLASPDELCLCTSVHQVPWDGGLWPDRHFCYAASLAGAAGYGYEAGIRPGNGALHSGRARRSVDPESAE